MLPTVDSSAQSFLQLDDWPAVSALADTAPGMALRRLEYQGFATLTSLGTLGFVVPFDDRLLAVGFQETTGTTAAVVFRR
jgi:hypothetical protein